MGGSDVFGVLCEGEADELHCHAVDAIASLCIHTYTTAIGAVESKHI